MKFICSIRSWVYLMAALPLISVCSCSETKTVAGNKRSNVLIGEYSRDWLKYKIFLLPEQPGTSRAKNRSLALNIRVINIMDNVSPLRKRSGNLDEYNTYYEYLLNGCKNEIYLNAGGRISYPVSYSYENNYNAFPFESINVGYTISKRKKKYELVYIDRVFSQDTVTFSLSL